MARALKLKLDELVFTFDLDMEEFGPEVVDVTGPHHFDAGGPHRSIKKDQLDFLEAQVKKAIEDTEMDDDDEDDEF
ncbi:MAG TPA: hypothetical protein VGB30_03220 [bacterium]|jgi:hypothetical protein